MESNLGVSDVVGWLRAHSQKFADMADEIEATFKSANGRSGNAGVNRNSHDVVAKIVALLSDGVQRRVPEIASAAEVDGELVKLAVEENPHVFQRGERGWISLVS